MLYVLYNVTEAAMNEILRNTEAEGAVLQIRKIGNSLGLILSKELLARLKLKEIGRAHV